MILAITFWFFILYLGPDWESPQRIVSIYGPYGERERCAEAQAEMFTVPGSLDKSPCFPQVHRVTYQDLRP